MATLPELLSDLDDEYTDCRRLVASLPTGAPEWDRATPAEGWAVRDHISHLAFFDEAGRQAVLEPEAFAHLVEEATAQSGDPMEVHLVRGRALDGDGLLAWWGGAHSAMMAAFADADPTARIPWFGPPMGALSFISARLMETWAHGTDVADALGVSRRPTERLRHVAHLGVRARPFSYAVRGLDIPPGRVVVDLTSPAGEPWAFTAGDGEPIAGIAGPALDFCLVVTQRRHVADTSLVVSGELATDWLEVAQAFAGPPGPGRPPTGR